MKSLSRLLTKERILWLESHTKEEALRAMVENISQTAGLSPIEDIYKAILDREKLLSTGFGLGLAIPHAKLPGIKDFAVGLGIHRRGLEYESLDDKPVHILVMIVGPNSHQEEYLQVLSRVTSFLKDNRENLLNFKDSEEIYQLTLDY
ncbi:MAG: PTS sugar transporter subunit IIA [Planctomycetes bacterium]|nr:PTS sugar transporter subunit IIA [Planctomycetota bacterium]